MVAGQFLQLVQDARLLLASTMQILVPSPFDHFPFASLTQLFLMLRGHPTKVTSFLRQPISFR